jgi:hypothetical protein
MAYNPMSGNSFVNAVGSTQSTPVVDTSPLIDTGYSANDNAINDAANQADQSMANINANDKKVEDQKAIDDANAKAAADAAAKAKALADAAAAAAAAAKAATDAANKKISDMNALALLKSTLSGYGIDPTGAISNAILGLQQANYDAPTIQALMEDPNSANSTIPGVAALGAAWNTRFAGNVGRRAAGLNPLTPAEYIATENGYAQVLNAAGVPAGFYDTPDAKAKLISGDISVTELQSRVDTAAKSISNQDPFYSNTLQSYYGLTPGQMIAHALDPATALPLLQRQQAATNFGAAASRQNLGVDVGTAQQYGTLGITQSQAEQGFQNISQNLPAEQQLASIYGGTNTQFGSASEQLGNLTSATFGGPNAGEAAANLKKLSQQEINAFSGSSGVDKNSLFGGTAGTY